MIKYEWVCVIWVETTLFFLPFFIPIEIFILFWVLEILKYLLYSQYFKIFVVCNLILPQAAFLTPIYAYTNMLTQT